MFIAFIQRYVLDFYLFIPWHVIVFTIFRACESHGNNSGELLLFLKILCIHYSLLLKIICDQFQYTSIKDLKYFVVATRTHLITPPELAMYARKLF